MRPFETATVLLLFVAWSSYLVPVHWRPRWLFVFPALAAAAAMVQLILEGYRWQIVPAYALATLLFIVGVPAFMRTVEPTTNPTGLRRRILRIAGMTLAFSGIVIAAALPVALPMFQLPTPTGPYALGTTTLEMVDPSRPEIYPPNTTAHRDLMVQVWYPAEQVNGARPRPYWTDAYGPYFSALVHMPGFAFDNMKLIPTHSYQDAPVAKSQPAYPVLIFSHGYGDIITENTVQMEELASHGYVVFSIAHPYVSAVVLYPDGRTVPSSPGQPFVFPGENSQEVQSAFDQCSTTSDPATAEACWRHFVALTPTTQNNVRIWTLDTRFVLDELERLNRGERAGLFAGRLDLDRIGVFGHSLGGATAGEVCSLDSRCKAGVNLDGFQYGDLLDRPVTQPFMIMYSNGGVRNDSIGIDDFMYTKVENQAYCVFVNGTRHFNYSDESFWWLGSPLGGMMGQVGPIDGRRMETILNRYLVAFFDKHLMGIANPLLDGPDPYYPEVDFQKR